MKAGLGALPARLSGYLFLTPALLGLTVFVLGPMLYAFGTVPTAMAIGLGLALLLNGRLPARGAFRTALFVTSIIAVAVVWAWIFHPDFGLLNAALQFFGQDGRRWLSSPQDALPALMLISVWRHVGYIMVIFLAGLQAIPQELVEAATVDGANAWTRFQRVIWPLIVTQSTEMRLVSVGLRYFLRDPDLGTDWGALMAASTLALAPIVALFLATQRQFIQGLLAGSLKG